MLRRNFIKGTLQALGIAIAAPVVAEVTSHAKPNNDEERVGYYEILDAYGNPLGPPSDSATVSDTTTGTMYVFGEQTTETGHFTTLTSRHNGMTRQFKYKTQT